MTTRRTLTFLLLLSAGCVHAVVQPLHSLSQATFEPAEKRVVWGRAVSVFQSTGRLISYSDSVGGVLRSATQATWIDCSPFRGYRSKKGGECRSTTAAQFTISDDGHALLRINRAALGTQSRGKSLFSPEDVKKADAEAEKMLDFIVGRSQTPPPPARLRSDALTI